MTALLPPDEHERLAKLLALLDSEQAGERAAAIAAGDPTRLRQIQTARGYKRGWVRHAMEEAVEKRNQNRGAAAA